MALSANVEEFLSYNPEIVGEIDGRTIYKNPIHGNLKPLLFIESNQYVIETYFYEMPTVDDFQIFYLEIVEISLDMDNKNVLVSNWKQL